MRGKESLLSSKPMYIQMAFKKYKKRAFTLIEHV